MEYKIDINRVINEDIYFYYKKNNYNNEYKFIDIDNIFKNTGLYNVQSNKEENIVFIRDIDLSVLSKYFKYKDIKYLTLLNCSDKKNILKKLVNLKYLGLSKCINIKLSKNNNKIEILDIFDCVYREEIRNYYKKDEIIRSRSYFKIPNNFTNLKKIMFYNNKVVFVHYNKNKVIKNRFDILNYNISFPTTLINLEYIYLYNINNICIPKTLINIKYLYFKNIFENIDLPKTLINLKNISFLNSEIILFKEFYNLQNITIKNNKKYTYNKLFKYYKKFNKDIIIENYNKLKRLYIVINNLHKILNEEKKIKHKIILSNLNNLQRLTLDIHKSYKLILPKNLNNLHYLNLFYDENVSLDNYYNLKTLILCNPKINHLPLNLNNLQNLNLKWCCNITNIPFYKNLSKLYLNNCFYSLDYKDNYISSNYNFDLNTLLNLKELVINNDFDFCNKYLKYMINLNKLIIRLDNNYNINKSQKSFILSKTLINLKKLCINNINHLVNIPKTFTDLNILHLTNINFPKTYNQKTKKLSIPFLNNLTELKLNHCYIKHIYKLKNCLNLKYLEINKVNDLYNHILIPNIPNLETLIIKETYINNIIFIPNLYNLKTLHIYNNSKITNLPYNLPELTELKLLNCDINFLPDSYINLQNLFLVDCKNIKEIPINLINIKKLYIDNCKNLMEIPLNIKKNIKKLYLDNVNDCFVKNYNKSNLNDY